MSHTDTNSESELPKVLDEILPAIWNAGHKYGRLVRNIDGTPKQITDAKSYILDLHHQQLEAKTPAPKVGELSPKALSELYYEAINVFPPSTNDMAGFRAIADLLEAKVAEARLDERKQVALDNYRGQTFSEDTNYQGKFEKFVDNNEKRIAHLTQGDTHGTE